MDNKARLLFRQRAEQRGLASSGRPAKAARTERASSAVGGHASASAGAFAKPPPASRGGAHGGDLPAGFFDSDGAPGGGTTFAPAPPRPPQPAANPAPSRVPADFRDAPRPSPPADATEERNVLAMVMGEDSDSEPDDAPAAPAPAPAPAAPAPPPKPAAPPPAPAPSAVPGGFFDSEDDAARARGEKPRKLTAEEELERFEKSVAAELEEVEAREEAEAEEAAAERAMREADEQAARVDAVRRLREAAEHAREQSRRRREAEAAAKGAAKTNAGDDADDSESDDDEFAEASLLDWRAKKL